MNKNDKRFIYAEMAFRDALVRLCREKKAAEIKVSELVREAGYSRSAFYAHYENMEGFIRAIIQREADRFISSQKRVPPRTTDMRALEAAAIQADTLLFSYIYDNRELWRMLLHDRLMDRTVDWMTAYIVKSRVDDLERAENGIFTNLDGTRWTIVDRYDPVDLELIFRALFAVYFSLIRFWEETGFRYSPNYMAVQRINSRHQFVPMLGEE